MEKQPCFLVQRKGEEERKFEREEIGLDSLEELGRSFWHRRGLGLEPLAVWAGPWAVGWTTLCSRLMTGGSAESKARGNSEGPESMARRAGASEAFARRAGSSRSMAGGSKSWAGVAEASLSSQSI